MNDAVRLQSSLAAMRDSRNRAQKDAQRAIEAMTEALKAVLDGERLAGMPNLGSSTDPLYASSVRAKAGSHTRIPLNFDPKTPTLVLTDRGDLVVSAHDGTGWASRPAEAADLRADDPEKIANTIAEAIAAHCRRAERSTRRFDRLAKFSRRLWEVCEYEEE